MEQDFSKKVVIVVRNDLPAWQVLNTVAHVSAYMGNKIGSNFGTGEFFISRNGFQYPRNSQYPIICLSAKPEQLGELMTLVRASGLAHIGFIREMIETTDDIEIESIVAQKDDSQVEYLGIGVFGDKEAVARLTKKFSLWK